MVLVPCDCRLIVPCCLSRHLLQIWIEVDPHFLLRSHYFSVSYLLKPRHFEKMYYGITTCTVILRPREGTTKRPVFRGVGLRGYGPKRPRRPGDPSETGAPVRPLRTDDDDPDLGFGRRRDTSRASTGPVRRGRRWNSRPQTCSSCVAVDFCLYDR